MGWAVGSTGSLRSGCGARRGSANGADPALRQEGGPTGSTGCLHLKVLLPITRSSSPELQPLFTSASCPRSGIRHQHSAAATVSAPTTSDLFSLCLRHVYESTAQFYVEPELIPLIPKVALEPPCAWASLDVDLLDETVSKVSCENGIFFSSSV